MNTAHDNLCASPEWAARLAEVIIPWGLAGLDLTGHVLELGGGFGASTAHLAGRLAAHTDRLTVLEADATLAEGLRRRFAGIDVRHADARAVPLPDGSIDAVVCFTMLHHVTPPAAQDKILAALCAVPFSESLQVWALSDALDLGYDMVGSLNLAPDLTEKTRFTK